MATADADEATGLKTRPQFLDALEREVGAAGRNGDDLALILCDIARFKAVNDALGPLICDRLLRRIAARLKRLTPDDAVLGRVTGDGFGVLLRDPAQARATCAAMQQLFARPFMLAGQLVVLDVHIGVARLADHADDHLSLLHAADIALHRSQRAGAEMIIEFDQVMRNDAARRHHLENDLRSAVVIDQYEMQKAYASQQFTLAYQPKHCLQTGVTTGFEALLRWRHPTQGMISPSDFIPIAESAGLIDLLGMWALRTACRDAAAWPQPHGRPLKVAVNMSPIQLRRGAFAFSAVEQALETSGLAPESLEVEVTESALMSDTVDTLTSIRRLGAGLALDDFGTGYSSLSQLSRFPFTTLKIDKAFVDALRSRRPDDGWMIKAIISLGAGLSMKTVAEGVEEEWQRRELARAGCDEVQGFLASPPIQNDAIADYVKQVAATTNAHERASSDD